MFLKNFVKKWSKLLIVLLVIASVSLFYTQSNNSSSDVIESAVSGDVMANVDLLGTGTPQQVYVDYLDGKTIIEVRENNQVVAQTELGSYGLKEASELTGVKLSNSSNKEYLHWVQIAGPHHFESIFFTIYDGQVRALMAADLEEETWYMPFWVSRGQDILVKDIDNDDLLEIVEFVDEYPEDAPRLVDVEIEKITKNEFDEDTKDDMWEIVSRENSGLGRGFRVAWNIYSFVDVDKPYFKKLNSEEYDEMVGVLLKDSPAFLGTATFSINPEEGLFTADPAVSLEDTISRNQIGDDSREFNNFVRDFWAGGYYQEPFGDHKPIIKVE